MNIAVKRPVEPTIRWTRSRRRCSSRWASTASTRAPRCSSGSSRASTGLISRHREPDTEVLRFPPVMSRAQLEKSGYLQELSAPARLRVLPARQRSRDPRRGRARSMPAATGRRRSSAADLVLSPAACYPVYPLVGEPRSRCRPAGLLFDVACDCFRHEPSQRSRPAAVVPHARIRLHRRAGAGRRLPRALDDARAAASPTSSACPTASTRRAIRSSAAAAS